MVVLLSDRVPARDATAAVALERIAYLIGTTIIIGLGSIVALTNLPLSPVWLKIFRGFAIGSGTIAVALALVLVRRDSFLLAAQNVVVCPSLEFFTRCRSSAQRHRESLPSRRRQAGA